MKKQPWEIVIKDRFLDHEKPENPFIVAILYFLVFFMSFLLIFVVFFQLCVISGDSMQTTLYSGEHVLLLRSSASFKVNDIVVITKKNTVSAQPYNIIKRVVAVAGEDLCFQQNQDGTVYLQKRKTGQGDAFWQTIDEPFIKEAMQKKNFDTSKYKFGEAISVPEGFLFVMGDNRNHSEDSRSDGPYPVSTVLGKMAIKIDKNSLLEYFLKFLYHEDSAPAN